VLILIRRPAQSIRVGEAIEVTIMEVRGNQVRLGINAPGGVPVYRKEIWLRRRAENHAAPGSPPEAVPATPGQCPGTIQHGGAAS